MSKWKASSPARILFRMALGLTLLVVGAGSYLAAMPRSDRHESRRDIDRLEDVWRNAVLKGNSTAMESLLADDFMGITPNGTLQSKEQIIASIRSGALRFSSLDITDRKVRFYGTTAIVNCRAEVQGSASDGNLNGSFRYTRVYARDARGTWRIVSFEANRIHESSEHERHEQK